MIDFATLPQVAPDVSLEELFAAGCHFGHQSKKWHPRMAPWIYAEQDGVHIFDLEKTAAQLQKAYNFVYQLGLNKKTLVVVGTKKQASDLVEKTAVENGTMYIAHRWMGGLLTNWEQVSKSVKRMNEIESGLATGKYNDYTKYERTMLRKELDRLERFFGGIKDLKRYPDAVLVVDVLYEKNAVKEVVTEKIPLLALIDSNSNPTGIEIPLPANDDAISSVKLILSYVLAGYKAGKEGKRIEPTAAVVAVKSEEPTVEKQEEKVAKEEEKELAEVKEEKAVIPVAPEKKAVIKTEEKPKKKVVAKTEEKPKKKAVAKSKKPAAEKKTAKVTKKETEK